MATSYNWIYILPTLRIMNNILYVVAVIFIVAWAIGYFGYNAGELIHAFIVVAIIALLLRVARGSRNVK